MPRDALALDRKSVRTKDEFGKLHVSASNISKATVNPYYGREIPGFERLGLDPTRVYHLLRDPEELSKAADTFNNLPILSKHVPVTADKPSKELVVGSTGTDAAFDEPYLRNSLVIWESGAILGIDSDVQRQLSAAYAYDADMTPGQYAGVKYDGVMRNIRGNHVALVEEGRAGPDVVVGDSKLLENPKMKLSAKAKVLLHALTGYAGTVIAQDAQIGDLSAVVAGVKTLTKKEQPAVVAAFKKHIEPHLAQDADLSDLPSLVAALGDPETPVAPNAMDDDMGAKLLAAGVPQDKIAACLAAMAGGAMDEDKEKDEETVDKPAMDAAIADAEARTAARFQAIRTAELDVQPLVGTLAVAMDSAEAVYKFALEQHKVPLEGIEPSAYKPMVAMLKRTQSAPQRTIAQDSATTVNAGSLMSKAFGKGK